MVTKVLEAKQCFYRVNDLWLIKQFNGLYTSQVNYSFMRRYPLANNDVLYVGDDPFKILSIVPHGTGTYSLTMEHYNDGRQTEIHQRRNSTIDIRQ